MLSSWWKNSTVDKQDSLASSSPVAPSPRPRQPPSRPWAEACTRLDATNPLLVCSTTAAAIYAGSRVWHRWGRRIRSVEDLVHPLDYSPRRLRGIVTSVGDADGCRFFHQPTLRPWLRPPNRKSKTAGETLAVRLAGVDAPEMAHFGKPAQPFSQEAFEWLTQVLSGRRAHMEVLGKDHYGRAVAMVYVRRFPHIRRRNVSELLLEAGLATVYEQAGAMHGGRLEHFRALERAARLKRKGMWSQREAEYESPAEYKRRSTLSKAAKDARAREFATVTGASTTEASRFLKATAWRLDAALDAFYSDPRSSSSAQTSASSSAALARNLEDVWAQYRDESNVDEIGMDGTMRYCADLAVDPEDVIMLALAWFTKAPTMGRFARSGWFEAWQTVRCDSLEQQRQYMETLRTRLTNPEGFKSIYIFAFDYAKAEGQKSLQFEIAQELWNLLIPLDPAASFPATHLASWIAFLTDRGGRAVSRDTWNLFLDFTRTTAADFSNYDEEAAWPSLIDDYVQSVLQR